MEESLLDITANSADTDCEERPVNRYGGWVCCAPDNTARPDIALLKHSLQFLHAPALNYYVLKAVGSGKAKKGIISFFCNA